MVIAIDGFEANVENRVGIGRYAFEILSNIHSIFRISRKQNNRRDIRFVVFLPSPPRHDMPGETEWWQYRRYGPDRWRTFVGLPLALMRGHPQPDVIFSPTHYSPRFVAIKRVISIMDLSYLSFPGMFKPKDLYQLKNWTGWSAAHASHIITISRNSRDAIIKAYGVPAGRVSVTYPGLIPMADTRITADDIVKRFGISRYYILSVGTLQPRKNYVRLIQAFAGFLRKNRQKYGAIDLVIVGKKGWLYGDILAAPEKSGIGEHVKFLDFVPDEALPSLYRHALCFALPSLYEGFGLPVAEAMSYGCPVVVSNTSSLPEIAGKAGIFVDPENTDSITGGLLAAVGQRNLMQGKQRIKLGLEQVKKFSWEKAAEETLRVLEVVGKS